MTFYFLHLMALVEQTTSFKYILNKQMFHIHSSFYLKRSITSGDNTCQHDSGYGLGSEKMQMIVHLGSDLLHFSEESLG
jgi:hypothetical protein